MSNVKRLRRELAAIDEAVVSDSFCLDYDDGDITTLHAVVKAPSDSLYAYRFLRFSIVVPPEYPFVPPKFTFHNSTSNRIHPNFYSKVCLSILNTWPGNPWKPSLTIETVLLTIQSLLDNEPYVHEPGQSNNETYNKWVDYSSWDTMFLNYLKFEKRAKLLQYMLGHVIEDSTKILNSIKDKEDISVSNVPYTYEDPIFLDWTTMKRKIKEYLAENV